MQKHFNKVSLDRLMKIVSYEGYNNFDNRQKGIK